MPTLPRAAPRLLATAVTVALVWVALRLALPAAPPLATREITDLAAAPVYDLVDLHAPPGGGAVELTGPEPSFVVPASGEGRSVRSLAFRFRPLRPVDAEGFMLSITPASGAFAGFGTVDLRQYRGMVRRGSDVVEVTWNLPVAASRCRILLGDPVPRLLGFALPVDRGPYFRLVRVRVTEEAAVPSAPETPAALLQTGRTLAAGLVLAVVLLGVGWAWPAARPSPGAARGLLVAAVGLSGVVMLCLLPPFQGPDEESHWKTGLSWARPRAAAEPALFNLCETLNAKRLAFHPERAFPPPALTAVPEREGMPAETWNRVTYATPLTYPAVTAVGLLFPRVETTPEALLFYHLSRALPLAALLGLLALAVRAGLLGYTALAFFASPLFLQQSAVVTGDTLPNLAAVAACLFFAARLRRPDRRLTAGLAAAALAAAVGKPVYAGMLLLPLYFVPWRRVPCKKSCLALLLGAGLLVVWALARERLRAVAALTDPELLADFTTRCLAHLGSLGGPVDLFRPLGWLDTPLGERHEALIFASLVVGVVLDLVTLGPALARGVRRAPGRAAAVAGLAVANLAGTYVALCLVMYATYGPAEGSTFYGIQQRYFFPPIILIALLTPALAEPPPAELRDGPAVRVAATVGLGLMGVLLAARQVELAGDLLRRYW